MHGLSIVNVPAVGPFGFGMACREATRHKRCRFAPGYTRPMCAMNEEKAEKLRLLPLVSSAVGVLTVVGNRLIDGANPALVASSSQSRADVATICIAAVLGLTGLQWLSLKPKTPQTVTLDGRDVTYIADGVKQAKEEIVRFWDAVREATQAEILVIFWKGKCVAHLGYSAVGVEPGTAVPGKLCQESQSTNSPRSLANLVLFPGRFEFLEFLPSNTQCLHVQPLHPHGVVVLGAATQRNFTILDQAWISTWCDKLFVALDKTM
ncbi:Protein COFACTOR ASSEMBLY OF COMPLEX C SUBUNIT B CCB4 [Picochlorum sp. SENEW3]|nr:Protein COFACTOR ASSEMBLY OF COMPLEX C SUBUNIT B CCB4 [Picochlorum sp. SENEW3]WPT17265.1 Protein COFACTOR ASSEMBLY OF COMPLEX C SUBUNIT B CCB4 [Picochlorum sp. SENEW3]